MKNLTGFDVEERFQLLEKRFNILVKELEETREIIIKLEKKVNSNASINQPLAGGFGNK